MKRFIRNIALAILASVAFIIFSIDLSCALFPTTITEGTYDCGIILGAAVTSNQPSPVFQARLDHGIDLYQKGVVKILIFTGGVGKGDHMAESEVGATYAQDKGVPASDTLMEKTSKTTVQNLLEAKRLMEGEGIKTKNSLDYFGSLTSAPQRHHRKVAGDGSRCVRDSVFKI